MHIKQFKHNPKPKPINSFSNSSKHLVFTQPNNSVEQNRKHASSSGLISSAQRDGNFQRLLDIKIQLKLEKGLFFWCDEKYEPNHHCKFLELRVILTCKENREEEEKFVHTEDKELEVLGT